MSFDSWKGMIPTQEELSPNRDVVLQGPLFIILVPSLSIQKKSFHEWYFFATYYSSYSLGNLPFYILISPLNLRSIFRLSPSFHICFLPLS